MRRALIALLVLAASAASADTYVRDGDTIVVDDQPWRLNGLNCPERGTEDGKVATARMEILVEESYGSIRCEWNGATTYDRKVGHCSSTIDGVWMDMGAIMIASGLCGRCDRYDPEGLYEEIAAGATYTGPIPKYCTPR